MNIMIFDTETTSIEKPFCYNIGYVIYNTESKQIIERKEFVCEQVWHNSMLFTTAYYANKREFYVAEMRARKIKLKKYGYIMQEMIRDIEFYEITKAFAQNSSFDERVFEYNCDWFKTQNPFDTVEIKDIRGYVHEFIATREDYQDFCEKNKFFTEAGNYSTTAEAVFAYITQNEDFIEAHTALADSEIEIKILERCLELGASLDETYKTKRSIERNIKKELIIIQNNEETRFSYNKKIERDNKIFLK